MALTSPTFFVFLLPAVALFYLLRGRFRPGYLLVLSYAVYGSASPRFLPLLIGATLATYLVSMGLAKARSRKGKRILLLLGVGSLCAVITLFKLQGLSGTLARALGGRSLAASEVLIPLGLSFYVFRLIGHLLDVSRDASAHEPNVVRFASWVAFFPQLFSGPIQRSGEFLPQLDQPAFRRIDFERIERGCGLILLGLFEKLVVADRIALFLAEVDEAPSSYGRPVLVFAMYGYILQMFADFAGYTHLALGIGRLFGIEGPPNFNAPFAASSIPEFWRRWHMTLTRWLRDYVYMPVRLRLWMRGWGGWGEAISIMTTMVLIGIWHRFSSSYLVYGIMHGFFMIVTTASLRVRDRFFGRYVSLQFLRRGLGVFVTFHLVVFAEVFAHASTVSGALAAFGRIMEPTTEVPKALPRDIWLPSLLGVITSVLLGAGLLDGLPTRFAAVPRWLAYALMFLIVILLSADSGAPFTYAQF